MKLQAMVTENLERAFAAARGVIANIKPDQLDDPTPCQSWTVRDICNHLIGGAYYFAESVDIGEANPNEDDYTEGDMVASYDDGIKLAIAAFNAPGAMEKTVTLPFGPLPVPAWMGIATTDAFTHAWDLAQATGQDTNLDPDFAAQLLEGAKMFIQPAFRGADTERPFGAEQQPPTDACNAARLAAFLGRRVEA
jgi:uncharacterized protein (TIGR03086 family)